MRYVNQPPLTEDMLHVFTADLLAASKSPGIVATHAEVDELRSVEDRGRRETKAVAGAPCLIERTATARLGQYDLTVFEHDETVQPNGTKRAWFNVTARGINVVRMLTDSGDFGVSSLRHAVGPVGNAIANGASPDRFARRRREIGRRPPARRLGSVRM